MYDVQRNGDEIPASTQSECMRAAERHTAGGVVAIGAMIHRNRADLTECDGRLSMIARLMPHVDREQRRRFRRLARETKRARLRVRLVGWLLRLIDPR